MSLRVTWRCGCSRLLSPRSYATVASETTSVAAREASSAPSISEEAFEEVEEDQPVRVSSSATATPRRIWLKTDGARFKRPTPGQPNWLGKTPFPLNPSFNPPTPLSEMERNIIFKKVSTRLDPADRGNDAAENLVIRKVAQEHRISIDRVKAVVKLKVAEAEWKAQGHALQTSFSNGMEDVLCVSKRRSHVHWQEPEDGHQPDLASSKHTLFEFISSETGERPILGQTLAQQQKGSKRQSALASQLSKEAPSSAVQTKRNKPNSVPLVITDVQDTPLGREWERTNENKSASEAVKKERQELRKKEHEANKEAWSGYPLHA